MAGSSNQPLRTFAENTFGLTFYKVLAVLALIGCAIPVLTDILMWFLVDGYNPISQTISELAAGNYAVIQDSGLYAFAAGIVLLNIGLMLQGKGTWLAYLVRFAMLALAGIIVVIGAHAEYGDGDPEEGFHLWLVGGIAVIVPFLLWAGASLPLTRKSSLSLAAKALAVVWVIMAPFYMMVPHAIMGAYERVLATMMVASVAIAAWQLYRAPD